MRLLLFGCLAFLTLGMTKVDTRPSAPPEPRVDPCPLFGAVFLEEVESFADYRVFREEDESFADLVVFREQAQSFADRRGLWFFTDVRGFADFTVAFTDVRGFADFSVHFSEYKSLAGCRN